MSSELEQRMVAMRARLSNLSSAVDEQDEARMQHRYTSHRYYDDVQPSQSNTALTARKTFTGNVTPHAFTLQERDVNQAHRAEKVSFTSTQSYQDGGVSKSHAVSPPPVPAAHSRGVDAMVQLARKHVAQSDTPRSAHPHQRADVKTAAAQIASPVSTPSMSALDLSGLHTYDFQGKLPSARRASEVAGKGPSAAKGKVGYASHPTSPRNGVDPLSAAMGGSNGGVHKYAQDNTSFSSVSSTRSAGLSGEAPFDAFRVVQERLRQKMLQLTTATSSAAATRNYGQGQRSEGDDAQETPGGTQTNKAVAVTASVHKPSEQTLNFRGDKAPNVFSDDSSPPPRPPPGARAETATPLRSPDAQDVEVSANTTMPMPTSARSRHNTAAHTTERQTAAASAAARETPIEVELSGASMTHQSRRLVQPTLYDPSEEEEQRNSVDFQEVEEHESCVPYESSADSSVGRFENGEAKHYEQDAVLGVRPTKPRLQTSRGTFSDPSSHCAKRSVADARGVAPEQRTMVGSMRTSSRSKSSRESSLQHRQSATQSQVRRQSGLRPSPSKSPSTSSTCPRGRSSTGSHRVGGGAAASAPRPKPISLNVEATILASVTGAELFALLRMRGLIDSEGDTEEYRLPQTRCHRLYVTADEHRQLQLLRQSIHVMEEEQRQDVPSYQRATVAARSRNSEFAPPPPVTRYIDR